MFLTVAKYLFLSLVLAGLASCVNHEVKLPKGYISEKDMALILVDVHLVEGARSGTLVLGDTNSLPDYYAKIYEKHHVTEANFKESFNWYTAHPEKLKAIYEEVIVSLSKLEEEVNARKKPNEQILDDEYEDAVQHKLDSVRGASKILNKSKNQPI